MANPEHYISRLLIYKTRLNTGVNKFIRY